MISKGRSRRLAWFVTVTVLSTAFVSAYFVRRERETRFLRQSLQLAREEFEQQRYSTAIQRLVWIEARRPEWSEAAYLIGLCEKAKGKTSQAHVAFLRVPEGSEFAGQAAAQLARIEISRGKFSRAEKILLDSLSRKDPGSEEIRRALILLDKFQERRKDARQVLLTSLTGLDPTRGVDVLRELWDLDNAPVPVDGIQSYLDDVARESPDDDRIWLARANLATRAGQFDEADRRLLACEKQRPSDPAVCRGRLEWARASDRPDRLGNCLAYVDDVDADFMDAEALAVRAWFAAARGDAAAEKIALSERIAKVPGDLQALDRLAEFAATAGKTHEAARFRTQRDEADKARFRYADLLRKDDPRAHAEALAQLARTMGLAFEAKWWTALSLGDPLPAIPGQPTGLTLASRLTDRDLVPGKSAVSPRNTSHPVRFEDDAAVANLAFTFESGRSAKRQLPETMSGGIALIDYDGDGFLDVYAVQGGVFPPDPNGRTNGDRLFRNKGNGTFEDVSKSSGIAAFPGGYGHGVAVGDVDNDGHPDLFITRWNSYALYHNRGEGTFEDVTRGAGLGGNRDWPTSAAFADLDNDGDLDLYVCHYLAWDADHPRECNDPKTGRNHYCTPAGFRPLPDHVFKNDGNLKFTDVTEEAGFKESEGRGLGVVAADLDDDGKIDIYVANDMSANFLYHNKGGFRFEEVGHEWGAATSGSGGNLAGMGIACGDFDRDGKVDLVVTNFFGESFTFHKNLGSGQFADHSQAIGMAAPTRNLLGFGVAMFDADNDGRLDLLSANGHVNDGRPQFPWKMPAQLLRMTDQGKVIDASETAGLALAALHLGRGLAAGDIDNDGRVDALIVAEDEPIVFLHNRTKQTNEHFLTLTLAGRRSNRDAIGARVTLTTGDLRWTAQKTGGGGYQSAGDSRLHFGLGSLTQVESIEIQWPSGHVDRLKDVPADRGFLVREGTEKALPQAAWKP